MMMMIVVWFFKPRSLYHQFSPAVTRKLKAKETYDFRPPESGIPYPLKLLSLHRHLPWSAPWNALVPSISQLCQTPSWNSLFFDWFCSPQDQTHIQNVSMQFRNVSTPVQKCFYTSSKMFLYQFKMILYQFDSVRFSPELTLSGSRDFRTQELTNRLTLNFCAFFSAQFWSWIKLSFFYCLRGLICCKWLQAALLPMGQQLSTADVASGSPPTPLRRPASWRSHELEDLDKLSQAIFSESKNPEKWSEGSLHEVGSLDISSCHIGVCIKFIYLI